MRKPERVTQRDRLRSAKHAVRKLVSRTQHLALPAFGPALSSLEGPALADAVIGHRIAKNLAVTGVSAELRREHTIEAMLAYDRKGLTTFSYRQLQQPNRGLFLQAKELLALWLRDIPRSYKFRPPSGETVESSFGMTDLLLKLEDPDQWRVSLEASHEAAAVCYHNTQLKRLVKKRFRQKHGPLWGRVAMAWALSVPRHKRAFHTFHRMFVDLCIIQNVSRVSSVPKNAEKDRPISMEPLWNMVAQLSYAYDLREQLYGATGIHLQSLAALHRTLIRHANKATVDFASASNSNWMCVIKSLYPKGVVSKLQALRTPICEYNGEYHYYNMLAPMGCGFTFEIMTLTLLALARVLDKGATVFGDDVVIEAAVAPAFISLTTDLGWVVNEKKSFVEGNFRESCGGFHDLAWGQDILSYDFHEITDLYEATTTCNKLFRLLEAKQCTGELRSLLLSCYCDLIRALPCDTFRDYTSIMEPLPDGVVLVHPTLLNGRTNFGVIEALVAGYWHRPVAVGRKWSYTQSVVIPRVDEIDDQAFLTAYLKRGCAYDVESRDKVLIYDLCEITGGQPLARVPLLSFI